MARYELGAEFWDITQDGKKLHIVAGDQRGGKLTVRTFVSAEHAEKQLVKLVGEKLAAGWGLVDSPTELDVRAPTAASDPRDEALERAIVADPYDESAYSVYGDWLQGRGSVRGELIALQLAEENDPENPKLRSATRKYLATHRHALAGGIDRYLEPPGRLVWRFGFVHRLELERDTHDDDHPAQVIGDVLCHPSGRFVAEIRVRDNPNALEATVDAIGQHGVGTLRVLELVAMGEFLPGLEPLANLPLTGLVVKSSVVEGQDGELAPACLRSLARVPATLRRLEIVFGGIESFAHLAPLFRRGDLGALRKLALRRSRFGGELCRALATSPFARQLVSIDLGMTEIETESLALLGDRGVFPALRELGLARDLVAPRQVTAFKEAGLKIKDVRTDPDDRAWDDGDYYEEVQE